MKVDLTIYGCSGRFFVQGSDEEIASVTAKKSIVKVSFIVQVLNILLSCFSRNQRASMMLQWPINEW